VENQGKRGNDKVFLMDSWYNTYMAYNTSRPSGRRDFSQPRVYTRQGGDRQMFKVVCSECGKDCEVPFKPTGDRPVFCSNCFESKRGGSDSRRPDTRSFDRPRFQGSNSTPSISSEQYNILNTKLDKILGLLNPMPEVKPEVKVVLAEKPREVVETKEPKVKVEKKKKTSKK